MNDDKRANARALSIAAYSYLAARERLAGATGHEVTTYACELDYALHELTNVAGFPCDGCECDDCERLRTEDHGSTASEAEERTAGFSLRLPGFEEVSDSRRAARARSARTRRAVRDQRQL